MIGIERFGDFAGGAYFLFEFVINKCETNFYKTKIKDEYIRMNKYKFLLFTFSY